MAKKRDVYTLKDGSPCDFSVSQLCGILDKPQLVPWAAKMTAQAVADAWKPGVPYTATQIEQICMEAKSAHRVAKDTAGDLGTRVHQIVGAYIEGQLTPDGVPDPSERKSLENFIKVTDGWEWLGSEITLVHEEYRYGGTADGLARLPSGMIVLPDFKTSNSVYATYTMQCALYAKGTPDDPRLHEYWKQIREGRILHWNKEFLTWEVLERNLEEQYPFIPAFVECARWKRRFETKSYAKKEDAIKVSESGDTTFRSNASVSIPPSPPASQVFIA